MSGLFGGSSAPPPPPAAPPAPRASDPQVDILAQQQAMQLQRGRTSTILTGGAGLSDMGSTSKTLLGQ